MVDEKINWPKVIKFLIAVILIPLVIWALVLMFRCILLFKDEGTKIFPIVKGIIELNVSDEIMVKVSDGPEAYIFGADDESNIGNKLKNDGWEIFDKCGSINATKTIGSKELRTDIRMFTSKYKIITYHEREKSD